MLIDCVKYYDALKKIPETFYKKKQPIEVTITEIAFSSGVPIIAICMYMMINRELTFKEHDEVSDLAERMKKFYGYTTILT